MAILNLKIGSCALLGTLIPHGASAQEPRREIVVVGAVHEATAQFGAQQLSRLLDRIKPDLILLELDPSFFDSTGALGERFRDVSLESRVAVAYATTSKASLRPFDIDVRNRFYQDNDYFARESSFNQALSRLHASRQLSAEASVLYEALLGFAAVRDACGAATLEIMNAAPCDSALARKHDYAFAGFTRIVRLTPELASYSSFATLAEEFWTRRNAAMVANIVRHTHGLRAARVVVLTGFEHRTELRRALASKADEHGFVLRDVRDY